MTAASTAYPLGIPAVHNVALPTGERLAYLAFLREQRTNQERGNRVTGGAFTDRDEMVLHVVEAWQAMSAQDKQAYSSGQDVN